MELNNRHYNDLINPVGRVEERNPTCVALSMVKVGFRFVLPNLRTLDFIRDQNYGQLKRYNV